MYRTGQVFVKINDSHYQRIIHTRYKADADSRRALKPSTRLVILSYILASTDIASLLYVILRVNTKEAGSRYSICPLCSVFVASVVGVVIVQSEATMVSISVVVCFAVVAVAAATDVQQCAGNNIPDLSQNVHLIPCNKIPCKLKKGTDQHITIAFTPDKDYESITNHVTATVAGLDLPFVGVDGKSICDKIYMEDGAVAGCPLKAGTKYLYKDSFPVLPFYPSIKVKVHWELMDNKEQVTCFEVDARIA